MLKSWRVRRAVLLVCGLGSALLALALLLVPPHADHEAVRAGANAVELRRAASELDAGRAPVDLRALSSTLGQAARALEGSETLLSAMDETRANLGVAFGFVAAMNLLLWAVTPARADEAVEGTR